MGIPLRPRDRMSDAVLLLRGRAVRAFGYLQAVYQRGAVPDL